MWKYDSADSLEAVKWSKYMKVYEEIFDRCNRVPWFIIPSDHKWYRNYLIANEMVKSIKIVENEIPFVNLCNFTVTEHIDERNS